MGKLFLGSSTFLIVTVIVLAVHVNWTVGGKKQNEGTNYEVDEDDIVTYVELGKPCDPAVQQDNSRKTGICRATLYCNPQVKRCDCEDIGPYTYTEENGKCKAYVGSSCYSNGQCVENASCKDEKCVCKSGKSCKDTKSPVAAL